LSVAFDE
jgi:hypothetical protein